MIYAILKRDIVLYKYKTYYLSTGDMVRIENHRNGDELYLLDNDNAIGFFPKGYLHYYTVKPGKLLDLVMK